MANYLIIYSSSGTASQILAANAAYYKRRSSTVKDVSGVSTGDIDTWIGTLTDDYYTEIYLSTASQEAAATGLLNYDQIAGLRKKMITANKGTTINAGTCQANITATEIILAAAASAVDDYYKDMYIVTAGTTAVYRAIEAYNGTSKVCTVNTTSTAVTTTETYIVYTNAYIYDMGVTAASGKTAAYRMWDTLFPNIVCPLAVLMVGGYQFAACSGTAASAAAGTITLAANVSTGDWATNTQHDTDDFYNGMYVFIYSAVGAAAAGGGQYRKITDFNGTTHVCTLENNWTVTPSATTITYRVVSEEERACADKAMEIYIKTYWYNIETDIARTEVAKVLDLYTSAKNGYVASGDAPEQDLDWLFNDALYRAKSTFLSDALAVV